MSKLASLSSVTDVDQLAASPRQELNSYAEFLTGFPLKGEKLYATIFDRHAEHIQTQKAKYAVANLEKILNATFEVSGVSGFDRMSLRDLSKRTGMSMGAIYSCIRKKEDIALMVADVVRLSSDLTRLHAMQAESVWSQIEQSIRFHLYASTLLQPWYFFLFFETRSLPEQQQTESKQIELDAIESFKVQIETGIASGEFDSVDSTMLANTIVVLLEDWYLKPWKTQLLARSPVEQEQRIDNYYQSITKLVSKLLAV
ncbi:MAG: AcrR family transcriptional regulator [Arenicella sp.]|jgi:AcrR family transcriptional regulator